MERYDALIELKSIERFYGKSFIAVGNVYGDSKRRFKNGDSINTSEIQSIDFVKGVIKTKNTTYKMIQGEML